MSVTANLTTNVETITATIVVEDETIIAEINTAARGPAGADGSGSNNITSATTSNGTADLDLLNVETVTATVSGTLTADHIHGNLAGNVYGHIRAGENLAKGDPVYVSGSHGSGSTLIPIVSKADASNAAKMPAVGIMDAAVANNANGHMVIVGTITELNTAGYTVNAELYVKAGGGFTATPPTARAQPVARVERANANNGAVIVKVNGLSASDSTASTLVRRDDIGGASFVTLNATTLTAAGISSDGLVSFNGTDAGDSLTFNMVTYTYGIGAASAHRIALGAGTTGAALFGAADAAAARTTLELGAFSTNGSITGTGALTFATAANGNLSFVPHGTGKSLFGGPSSAATANMQAGGLIVGSNDASTAIGLLVENRSGGDGGFAGLYRNSGAAMASGNRLGGFLLGGSSSAASIRNSVLIAGYASQTWTDGSAYGAELRFETTINGATTRTPWMTLGNNGTLSLAATTSSTSTTTGALVVSGGAGIAGAVNSLYQRVGSGAPEGVVTAPVGAVFHRTNGGAGTSFYVKESGTGNTGWVAK